MFLILRSIDEEKPGPKWHKLFEMGWPLYKRWFLSEGYNARPGYLTSSSALYDHMPEIFPLYENLVELVGGGDLEARFLSGFSPPAYMSGCSQVAWTKGSKSLIRNYDYDLKIFEGVLIKTNWLQPVLGMSDCLWGLLDGVNGSGLIVSLTFGGRKMVGTGFGIPLVQRYILETCANTQEAIAVLVRIPVHMSYNVTMLDKAGAYATVYLSPDREAVVTHSAIGTNHQTYVEWEDYARLTATVERWNFLEKCLLDPEETEKSLLQKFLHPPLFNTNYKKAFGTLYTAAYHPEDSSLELLWPGKSLKQSLDDFQEKKMMINLGTPVKTKLSL